MLISRPRTHDDCVALVSWIADAKALYLFSGPVLQWPLTVQQLIDSENAEGRSAWAVLDSHTDGLVGHFDLTVQGTYARIGRVIVAPEQRGQGLGLKLVNLAMDRAGMLGATQVGLNVLSSNTPAIRAYQRAGFQEIPSDRADVTAMRRSLLPA